jgi:hypothetical protein
MKTAQKQTALPELEKGTAEVAAHGNDVEFAAVSKREAKPLPEKTKEMK